MRHYKSVQRVGMPELESRELPLHFSITQVMKHLVRLNEFQDTFTEYLNIDIYMHVHCLDFLMLKTISIILALWFSGKNTM